MDRREFLQNLAATSVGLEHLKRLPKIAEQPHLVSPVDLARQRQMTNVQGHTLLCEFDFHGDSWRVYEDLRVRDGQITFASSRGKTHVLTKNAEASFAEGDPPFLGLSLADIGMTNRDLLAEKLLAAGSDPHPQLVKSAAPPQGSAAPGGFGPMRARWDTFVGTKECFDTAPVYPGGSTRTYHPDQYLAELRGPVAQKRFDGLIGGWTPAVRKIIGLSDASYCEIIVFGDTEARDKFIVQTWHRTALVENGSISKVFYGHSYPAFPPARQDPKGQEFYRALLIFSDYWERQLRDFPATSLPDRSWLDMAKHAFAKELMVRPGGVYPKYGAVDRDYYGSEYDGFQDVFTSSVYANLEWGRFEQAAAVIDNYLSDFTDVKGMVNMRGPETAQFGLTLSLLARYFNYTGDSRLLLKHRGKIQATAKLLSDLHDQSLELPQDNPGHGLIHGWSESDACLAASPSIWWLPYYANSAFAARGLKDIGRVWLEIGKIHATPTLEREAEEWIKRSHVLQETTIARVERNIWKDQTPPYTGLFPGAKLTFRDSMAQEHPSPQQWAHRPYCELLQADVLPRGLANTVIDCMRAFGATTLGVVANVGPPRPNGRAILGFISYGYAQMLLRLDRIEEFLLFLYSHRYHAHTRGSWTAGEVSGITGGTALFCIPAQLTIPLLVRWMLVLEDSDDDRLHFAKAVPRDWVGSGRKIEIVQAPTRWGKVNFRLLANLPSKSIVATVELARPGVPREIHVKLRLPTENVLQMVSVNGQHAGLSGVHGDTVVIGTGREKTFEVVGQYT